MPVFFKQDDYYNLKAELKQVVAQREKEALEQIERLKRGILVKPIFCLQVRPKFISLIEDIRFIVKTSNLPKMGLPIAQANINLRTITLYDGFFARQTSTVLNRLEPESRYHLRQRSIILHELVHFTPYNKKMAKSKNPAPILSEQRYRTEPSEIHATKIEEMYYKGFGEANSICDFD